MAYRTLGELRAELIRRLGFGASGASAGVITATVDSFLQNAYTQLYWNHDWKRLRFYDDKDLGVGQTLIDYPTGMNPERIYAVYVVVNGVYTPVEAGISPEQYTNNDVTSWPQRYEFYDQIELFPPADQAYVVRIWGIKDMNRFTNDDDVPNIDDSLIFLHALANAKMHYRQADGQVYQGQLEGLLSKLKKDSWTKTVFNRNTSRVVLAKPQVID